MIAEQHKILIHRAIDGELSNDEQATLTQLLQSSIEARQFFDRIKSLSVMSSELATIEPPASLRHNILERVASRRQATRPTVSNPRAIGALIGSLFTTRVAFGMAAGLLIGITVGSLALKNATGTLDPLDISGTVLAGKDSQSLRRVDSDSFSNGQASGRVAVDAGAQLKYIQVDVKSAQEIAVVIDYDPTVYTVRAFEQQGPNTNNVVTGEGQLRATHVGNNKYLFVLGQLTASSSPVICRVESTGVVYERELQM